MNLSYDSIETAVRDTLERIIADWNSGKKFIDWTAEVALRLCQLSKSPEYHFSEYRIGACSRGRPRNAEYGEWLYDICWYVEDEFCLTHFPLVGECEWRPDGACDGDFQKLLQARAEHRLWIFHAATAEAAKEMFDGCKENIKRFHASQQGDRYLFAARVWDISPTFLFDLYIHS